MWTALFAAAASAIGAAIASGDEAKARAIRQEIADKIGAEHLPEFDKVVAQELPPDAAQRYAASSQGLDAQRSAIQRLTEVVNDNGETPEDTAAFMRARNEAAGIESAGRSAIARSMANRGMGGSGVEAALMAQSNQAATNRGADMDVEAAAAARQRMMQAIGMLGERGASLRGQELSAMGAQDAINMFNARARTDATMANNANAQLGFENRMSKDAAQSNALNGVANDYMNSAAGTRKTANGVGQSIATFGAGFEDSNGAGSDDDKKKKKGA
jgi:hypothetical protein